MLAIQVKRPRACRAAGGLATRLGSTRPASVDIEKRAVRRYDSKSHKRTKTQGRYRANLQNQSANLTLVLRSVSGSWSSPLAACTRQCPAAHRIETSLAPGACLHLSAEPSSILASKWGSSGSDPQSFLEHTSPCSPPASPSEHQPLLSACVALGCSVLGTPALALRLRGPRILSPRKTSPCSPPASPSDPRAAWALR